jgi:ABC-type antimicrobial peptide transport system permease subunit
MAAQRLSLWLTTSFAGLAIVMLISGLYGVLAQMVGYRRREIGIRMALGASRQGMAIMIVRQGTTLILLGLLCGLGLSMMLGSLLKSFLYGVQTGDAWTIAGVVALSLLVGIAASLVPAYRASSVEPMEALREG